MISNRGLRRRTGTRFQFLIGRLIISLSWQEIRDKKEFQFLIGRLIMEGYANEENCISAFQFLIGRLIIQKNKLL